MNRASEDGLVVNPGMHIHLTSLGGFPRRLEGITVWTQPSAIIPYPITIHHSSGARLYREAHRHSGVSLRDPNEGERNRSESSARIWMWINQLASVCANDPEIAMWTPRGAQSISTPLSGQ
ncbi:hypothetical protein NHX12_008694 [Muraenolepis orangiensis]|uniref:Uncharacterized protein n=1 Tax=Muraenolepis orangiensis TaxID=630683 RepID=A0A9Q0DL85_9TELE|nr:hypothetical protein NHX12_008694 [Muraenolepis orangiensis]